MKKIFYTVIFIFTVFAASFAQQAGVSPCKTNAIYRALDFWIGDWDVYGPKGKAGDSKIELILDSCIILENWTSANTAYAGKSFNTFNAANGEWQQTWVDNAGGSIEFLRGKPETGKMTFWADNIPSKDGKHFHRRLTFINIDINKVRQLGERSDDDGKTWQVEYDLEYRRKL